jgi:hypothetical protein
MDARFDLFINFLLLGSLFYFFSRSCLALCGFVAGIIVGTLLISAFFVYCLYEGYLLLPNQFINHIHQVLRDYPFISTISPVLPTILDRCRFHLGASSATNGIHYILPDAFQMAYGA